MLIWAQAQVLSFRELPTAFLYGEISPKLYFLISYFLPANSADRVYFALSPGSHWGVYCTAMKRIVTLYSPATVTGVFLSLGATHGHMASRCLASAYALHMKNACCLFAWFLSRRKFQAQFLRSSFLFPSVGTPSLDHRHRLFNQNGGTFHK